MARRCEESATFRQLCGGVSVNHRLLSDFRSDRGYPRQEEGVIVVVDSGIWISGFHFGGTPLAALDQAFIYDQLAICDEIMTEISKSWCLNLAGLKQMFTLHCGAISWKRSASAMIVPTWRLRCYLSPNCRFQLLLLLAASS